jgi:hypothetical protein
MELYPLPIALILGTVTDKDIPGFRGRFRKSDLDNIIGSSLWRAHLKSLNSIAAVGNSK